MAVTGPPSCRGSKAGSSAEADEVASTAPRLKAWQRQGVERRAARRALYEEAVRRRKEGVSIKAIARAMKLSYPTVRKFVFADVYPERAHRPVRPTLLLIRNQSQPSASD